MFSAIVVTVTRGMLLAYLLGVAATVTSLSYGSGAKQRGVMRKRTAIALLLICVLYSTFLTQWMERFDLEREADLGTILGRADEYTAFLEAFISSPVLGKGIGYVAVFPSKFDFTLRDRGITVPHNHLVFFAGTTGIVGMLLYYGVLGATLARLWRASRQVDEDDVSLALLAGMIGALISGVAFTLTSTTFTTLSYNLFLAVIIHCAWTDWRALWGPHPTSVLATLRRPHHS
jgi:O-antigen ligase